MGKLCNMESLDRYTGTTPRNSYLQIVHIKSADPGLSHGRGGAWDHLWCGLHLLPN